MAISVSLRAERQTTSFGSSGCKPRSMDCPCRYCCNRCNMPLGCWACGTVPTTCTGMPCCSNTAHSRRRWGGCKATGSYKLTFSMGSFWCANAANNCCQRSASPGRVWALAGSWVLDKNNCSTAAKTGKRPGASALGTKSQPASTNKSRCSSNTVAVAKRSASKEAA
jgi:hypothetical protein